MQPPGSANPRESAKVCTESGDLLQALERSLPLGLLCIDPGGRVILWNVVMARTFAEAAGRIGESLAETLAVLADPMRAENLEHLFLVEALERGQSSQVEAYPAKGRDGRVRLFDIDIGPLETPDGRRCGALSAWRDVTTSRRRQDSAVRNARTSSLAAFGASIAHEIRNPLNSIALNLQLLREGIQKLEVAEGGELIEETSAVLEEIETLNRVVGELLRFARDPAPDLAVGDAAVPVGRALRLLAGQARETGVRVTREITPLAGVRIDEDMLSRAIYNIALNAVQAMEEGGELRIRTEPRRHSAVIEIADTGPGIPPEERERVFDLFYSRRPGGTGIGLPLAHRIVEGHGGHITLDTGPQGGSVFLIHLPWAPAEQADT